MPVNPKDVEALAREVPELMAETRQLAIAMADDRLERRRETRRIRTAIGVGLVMIVFMIVLAVSNRMIITRISDCSEPTGECYQVNQRTTAGAVEAVVRQQTANNVQIATCLITVSKPKDVRSCVDRALQ